MRRRCGSTSARRPRSDQSWPRGGAPGRATLAITAQFVRRWSADDPAPIGYTTALACIPPAMTIERPVANAGQSRAPRHSIVPFQRGGPSSG